MEVNKKQLADIFGASIRTIQNWQESMMAVNTCSRLQHNCDWGRQTSWSQMRMALFRSRTG